MPPISSHRSSQELVLDLNRQVLAEPAGAKELAIVPRASHLFEQPGALEQVAQLASDWFRRYFVDHRSA